MRWRSTLSLYHRASERTQALFLIARQPARSLGKHFRPAAQCFSLRRYRSSVIAYSLHSRTIFHCLIDPFETEEDLAQYLNARDELERSSYFDSQPSSRRERRSAGITPRVDDRSNVREIPPYLHIVDGEPFVNKDNFVQDMQALYRSVDTSAD